MRWREQLFILMTLPTAKDSSLIDRSSQVLTSAIQGVFTFFSAYL